MLVKINPVPKPRQTQRDKWAKRACVVRYRAFCDEIRFRVHKLPEPVDLRFEIAMPKSWSESKKAKMDGMPHRQKPDLDNLVKACLDALVLNDEVIADFKASKRWARQGGIFFAEPIKEP